LFPPLFLLPLSFSPLLWDSHHVPIRALDSISQLSEGPFTFLPFFLLLLLLDNLNLSIIKFTNSFFHLLKYVWAFVKFSFQLQFSTPGYLILFHNFYLYNNNLYLVRHCSQTFLF
jgi:hypothetical protein